MTQAPTLHPQRRKNYGPGSFFGTGKIWNGLFLNGYNSDQGNFGTVIIRNGENSEKTVWNNEYFRIGNIRIGNNSEQLKFGPGIIRNS